MNKTLADDILRILSVRISEWWIKSIGGTYTRQLKFFTTVMVQGVLRIYGNASRNNIRLVLEKSATTCCSRCKVTIANGSATRWLSTHVSRRLLQKEAAKVEKKIAGIPYKQLTIGVPKEVWKNERRYVMNNERLCKNIGWMEFFLQNNLQFFFLLLETSLEKLTGIVFGFFGNPSCQFQIAVIRSFTLKFLQESVFFYWITNNSNLSFRPRSLF